MPNWKHQDQAAAEANIYPKRALFWSPRLGKTKATVETIKAWGVTRGIVVAPLLVCPMWERELQAEGLPTVNAYSGPLQARSASIAATGDSILVINYDVVKRLLPALLRHRTEFLVADESHWIKSPDRSGRAQAVRRLAWNTERVRLLTGTPAPNHFGELWGQMTCVDPERWGKAHGRFAAKFLVRDTMYPSRIIGYTDKLEDLNKLVASGADIRRREDIFGPDDFQYIQRQVELPDKARKLYRKLAKQFVLELEKDGVELVAPHVLSRLTRLQQLTSGYLPVDTGRLESGNEDAALRANSVGKGQQAALGSIRSHTSLQVMHSRNDSSRLPLYQGIHTAKIDAVVADLDEIVAAGEKAIIFHRFRWEGARYSSAIRQAYPGAYHGQIDGSVRVADRARLVDEFNSRGGSAVMVIQTQSGGIGISLAEATHALFVSCDFSWDHLKQALDRVYNRGTQEKPLRRCITTYIVPGTVDEHIQSILDRKSDNHFRITHADLVSLAFGTSGVKI